MKVVLNSKEYLLKKEFSSLNALLQSIQEDISEEKLTITGVSIDGIDHNIDFFDKTNDIDCEFIEEINIQAESVIAVCIDVINQMDSYLNKIIAAIPDICQKYKNNEHTDATQNLYDILEGIRHFTVAFNSMASMCVLDMESGKTDKTTFWDSLGNLNDSFLLIVADLKDEKYLEVAEKIERDIPEKIKSVASHISDFKNQIVK